MTEKCPVCGAHIDMTFASQDMNDFCITKTSGEQAELRVRYVCNYCRIGFERAETLRFQPCALTPKIRALTGDSVL